MRWPWDRDCALEVAEARAAERRVRRRMIDQLMRLRSELAWRRRQGDAVSEILRETARSLDERDRAQLLAIARAHGLDLCPVCYGLLEPTTFRPVETHAACLAPPDTKEAP